MLGVDESQDEPCKHRVARLSVANSRNISISQARFDDAEVRQRRSHSTLAAAHCLKSHRVEFWRETRATLVRAPGGITLDQQQGELPVQRCTLGTSKVPAAQTRTQG